jgi:hypothetical protein
MSACSISGSNSVQCGSRPGAGLDMAFEGSTSGPQQAGSCGAPSSGGCGSSEAGGCGDSSSDSSSCDSVASRGSEFLAGMCDKALNAIGCGGGGCSSLLSGLLPSSLWSTDSKKKREDELETV